ncbi:MULTISPECIES: LysR family transcriptional regulator [Pseudomonas]|jgi:DNA-binding transcriptional LysR family regulator|uniref:LysR family transcriptional regulator n=1 Tax=Pseudomonas putida NBRC 14164 TaxID=1211579 RepID=A0ABN5UJ15_PSEPU|nr:MULTISPECIES: LysR family transcriptional regulator [Pseudomonas]EKT4463766.1 LysR family transcriptional regulator [Pseudomonas putida]EKT4553813.1 LysR family transcriptional regulator [Pseudomonas putida]ELF6206233.1 LysR family transcriptional regulator [Pseudomonas putida]MCC9008577.1 LysR family transcriptional regulator [Pseudomonas putida]MCX9135190.1 LysR family transcriptional regulator [Pseudomonas sp. DCB_PUT]
MTPTTTTLARDPEAKRFLNDRLDWNLLRTFLVIGQEGSISRAAARLHLSQPAVSQALRRLEEQLDSALVVRRGPRINLSKAGEEVMQIAAELYGTVSRLGPALDSPAETVTGKIRLLSISRIQSRAYDDFLAQFHSDYPQVELEIDVLRSSDVASGLLQKTASFGLSLCRTPQPRLEQRVLLEQRYAFFCGKRHRLFGRKNLTVADLQGENFVSFTSDQMGGNLSPLTVFRDQQGFTGRIVASSPSLDEILRLVGAGYGIGCLPEHIVAADVQANELWRLPPWEGVIDVNVYLLWNREQKLTQAESIFLERFQQMLMTTDPAERF